jgi:Mg/Co/Ni transporter MgtE
MLAYVIKAELRENYKIYIEFNDGLSGIIDFKDKITTDHREIIRELVDKNKFNKIKIERHTLCWENGVDFAPEYLYDQIKTRQKIA